MGSWQDGHPIPQRELKNGPTIQRYIMKPSERKGLNKLKGMQEESNTSKLADAKSRPPIKLLHRLVYKWSRTVDMRGSRKLCQRVSNSDKVFFLFLS